MENTFGWLKGVRNIIFDLGGVVIDLNRHRAAQELIKLGVSNADELLGQYVQHPPFLDLETGKITAGDFFDILRTICLRTYPDHEVTDKQLTDAFNAFLVDLPIERLTRLRELRMAGFRVFALSNTNPVMYNSWIAEKFRQESGNINDYFDGIVTSFQERTCKPDAAIFETVLRRYGLPGNQTLMLDDSDANCKAAAECGIHALRIGYTPADDMMAYTGLLLSLHTPQAE